MIFDNPGGQIEDAIDGFYQVGNSWKVALGFFGTFISIAFFNFAGVSVTKQISATTRTVLDSVRTFVVWAFSLAFFGQRFSFIQLIGFFVLLLGMFLYNNVVIRPFLIERGILHDSYYPPHESDRDKLREKTEEEADENGIPAQNDAYIA